MSEQDMSEVKVFISYKEENKMVARELKQILTQHTGRLSIFIAIDSIPEGKEYFRAIKDELKKSDLLFLLFTDRSLDWDWCLFETGLFIPLDIDEFQNVICFHSAKGDPPEPLKNLQVVRADKESLTIFLKRFYWTGEITGKAPLNPDLRLETINKIAESIESLFLPKELKPVYNTKRFVLDISGHDYSKSEIIPKDSEISGNFLSFNLIGWHSDTMKWSEFEKRILLQKGKRCIEEIKASISAIIEERPTSPITATVEAWDGGKIYKPIIYRTDWAHNSPEKFYLIFSEEIAPDDSKSPGTVGTLFSLIRMCNRARWEVIEPALKDIENKNNDTDFYIRVKDRLSNVIQEAEKHGYLRPENVKEAFPSVEDKNKVLEMFKIWNKIETRLFEALKNNDKKIVKQYLKILKDLNQDFSMIAARSYCDFVSDPDLEGDQHFKIGWYEYAQKLELIANKLKEKKKNYKPHIILGLSNGGMAFGDFLIQKVYREEAKESPIPITSIWIDRSRGGINLTNDFNESIINVLLKFIKKSKDFKVLLVDDYMKTGVTIKESYDYLKKRIPNLNAKFLTLFSYGKQGLKENKDNLLWFSEYFRKDYKEENEIFNLHVTKKHILPYNKDMIKQY